jgi:AcrR family transcriptional regulator
MAYDVLRQRTLYAQHIGSALGTSNPAASLPIWARPEPAVRRPRFTREQIAAVALEIADAEGFEAVSMRRIAAVLGAGTMSLYRYIATKDDLIALMDDALLGETLLAADELPADWRPAISRVARRTRDVLLAHPWALQSLHGDAAAAGVPLGGPNRLRRFELALQALSGAPLGTAAKVDLLALIDDFVYGHVLNAAEINARTAAAHAAGHNAEVPAEFLAEQLRSGRYPQLQALAADRDAPKLSDASRLDERFDLGLAVLIDGACARLCGA